MYFSEAYRLAAGRTLGYAEFGDPAGRSVFCFFGLASRRFYPVENAIAVELGVRVILVDLPGIGLAEPRPGWTLLEMAEGVGELAKGLGLSQWAVVGIQRGGPLAAALAVKFPRQVTALNLVSSPTPPDAPIKLPKPNLIQQMSARIQRYRDRQPPLTQVWIQQNPLRAWQRFHHGLNAIDREIFEAYGPRYLKPAYMRDVLDELYRQGVEGAEQVEAVLAGPWGFNPSELQVPTTVWQGEMDEETPPVMGRYLAQTISGSQLHEVPRAGHWWYLKGWREVLTALVT